MHKAQSCLLSTTVASKHTTAFSIYVSDDERDFAYRTKLTMMSRSFCLSLYFDIASCARSCMPRAGRQRDFNGTTRDGPWKLATSERWSHWTHRSRRWSERGMSCWSDRACTSILKLTSLSLGGERREGDTCTLSRNPRKCALSDASPCGSQRLALVPPSSEWECSSTTNRSKTEGA